MKRIVVPGLALAGIAVLAITILGFFDLEPILRDRAMRDPDDACPRLGLGDGQCAAIVEHAMAQANLDPDDIDVITMGRPDGMHPDLGGYVVAVVDIRTTDGAEQVIEVRCVGVGTEHKAWCTEDPTIEIWAGANHDVPCAGEPPDGCATPIVLDPDALAAARPLRIAAIDVPATIGAHDIFLGYATIPNGYLRSASLSLADQAPDGVRIPDGIRLELVPTDPTRPPLGNVYDRGTFPGVEEIEARLSYVVAAAPDGAVLQVRDVVVE